MERLSDYNVYCKFLGCTCYEFDTDVCHTCKIKLDYLEKNKGSDEND
ncbi:hypothetical protein [Sedimentibacter sp.]|nr:hypothetical protein [Sedimentibacter sp.]